MQPPTFRDVLEAQRRIKPYLARTPLHTYSALNALLGTDVYLKHENYQPVGAFKVRGGINLSRVWMRRSGRAASLPPQPATTGSR